MVHTKTEDIHIDLTKRNKFSSAPGITLVIAGGAMSPVVRARTQYALRKIVG